MFVKKKDYNINDILENNITNAIFSNPSKKSISRRIDIKQIFNKHMSKFIQINNFLKIVEDSIEKINIQNQICITELCCGKSYLSFILYYYFKEVKKIDIKINSYDLKKDVIENCETVKAKLGYNNINFLCADITKLEIEKADMVLGLHACDTLTDFIINYGIKTNAKAIIVAPCCHKEIAKNITINNTLSNILKYGLLKQRFSAILTDGIRANLLENFGYSVDVMEFVDYQNTPKNLLIKAIKNKGVKTNNIDELLNEYKITHSLKNLLDI